MDDAPRVGVVHRVGDGFKQFRRPFGLHGLSGQFRRERLAVHQFQREKRQTIVRPDVVNLHDVRVLKLGDGFGLGGLDGGGITDPRHEHGHRRPDARLGRDADVAVEALHRAVHGGQAEAGALGPALGREERVEGTAHDVVAHPAPPSLFTVVGSTLPCSDTGHRPRGRTSMITIMARAMNSWRRMDASRRPSVMACSGPAT